MTTSLRKTKNSGPCRAATNVSRVQLPGSGATLFLPYYIFLIATYRRTSGSDLTATTPSAAAPAAMVIAVTYPSVRITYLLSSTGPRQRPATLMSRIPERAARCAGGRPGRRAYCLPAAGLLTWLPPSATAADEDVSLRITACKRAVMSRG